MQVVNDTKKHGFDILKGKNILSYSHYGRRDKNWDILTDSGCYRLLIEDSGPDNNSVAYLKGITNFNQNLGKKVVEVTEKSNSYGAEISLKLEDGQIAKINLVHEQNGYYGFCYNLIENHDKNEKDFF